MVTDTESYGSLTETEEYGAYASAPYEFLIGPWPTFRKGVEYLNDYDI
jgi:hypothetical protein